jgi:hypothetical protein
MSGQELAEATATVVEAVETLEDDRIAAACDMFIRALRNSGEHLDIRDARHILTALRRKRLFTYMQRIGDVLIRFGRDEAVVYRQYSQALIDQGLLIPAVEMLNGLLARTQDDPGEIAEIWGLLGRAHKQMYVEAAGTKHGSPEHALREAIRCYSAGYNLDPLKHHWHGINVVALMTRAERDGIAGVTKEEREAVAEQIVQTIDDLKETFAWDCASAFEACIALSRWDDAEIWLKRYLRSPDADAFGIAGTLRQFTEVWGFNSDGGNGGDLVALLQAALLKSKDGAVTVSPYQLRGMAEQLDSMADPSSKNIFERVLGDTGTQTYEWLQKGITRAHAVGMVRQLDGRGIGTGFLVRGGDLRPDLGDEQLFLTNAHVISDETQDRALSPEDVRVTFEARRPGAGPDGGHRVADIVWRSGRDKLDACLIRLDPAPTDLPTCEIAKHLPIVDAGNPQRLYVIGHPEGRGLEFSLQDNLLLDYERPPESLQGRCLVHYRSPTEPGSSGSPVFEQCGWRVVALHHAGGDFMARLNGSDGSYAANEGIWIGSIKEAMAQSVAG